jgi:ABC-type transporter Mla subunit MlaD
MSGLNRRHPDSAYVTRGAAAIAIVVLLAALSYSQVFVHIAAPQHGKTVTARFGETKQLKVGDPVRVQGVKVGRVQKISLEPDERNVRVQMEVDRKALPLYANATANAAIRNLLGGAYYVSLDRGTARAGELGSRMIDMTRNTGQVEVDDLTSLDRGQARRGLKILPGELAKTFATPDIPAAPLEALDDNAKVIAKGVHAVRGQALDEDLKQMIRSTDATVRALDAPAASLRALVGGGAATVMTTAARGDDIRYVLAKSPEIQTRAQRTMTRLTSTLRAAEPLVASLRATAPKVAPALAALRPSIEDTDVVLRDAGPLLHSLRPTSRSLARTAAAGPSVIKGLDPSYDHLINEILPRLNKIEPETQLTAAQSVGPFFSLWGGAAGQVDTNGHFFRFPAGASDGALSNDLPCRTYLTDPNAAQIAACESLSKMFADFANYNPLKPPPGSSDSSPTSRKKGGR